MKNMVHVAQSFLRGIFLNKETSQQIHDIKNKYTGTAIQSITKTERTRRRIEETITYKYGLAVGGKRRGL